MNQPKHITIFYSWQSDLPNDTNRNAIRSSIREAFNKIEEIFNENNILLILDEATRGVSGSPNIPVTIINKIEKSDIFIADVSIINNPTNEQRACPNPNVIYELGFATAHLGWERIIMLFNNNFGKLSDLPFDFDRHRVSPYTINNKKDNEGKGKLTQLIQTAIQLIIDSNPKRPSELKELSAEQQQKIRDKKNIIWVLSSLHIPTVDQYLLDSPKIIWNRAIHFWEGFNGVMINSLFYLYDKELESNFRDFHQAWQQSLSYDKYYFSNHEATASIFVNQNNSNEEKKALDAILEANINMRNFLNLILKRIRENYIDIDIIDTNRQALQEYLKFTKED